MCPSRTSKVYACGFPAVAPVALSENELVREVVAKKLSDGRKVEAEFKPRDFEFVLTAARSAGLRPRRTRR
jgi:hypothetical protein